MIIATATITETELTTFPAHQQTAKVYNKMMNCDICSYTMHKTSMTQC